MTPKELYELFFAYYGPQSWWPGEGFEIVIGAILTQNTSWRNVELALTNLKKHNILNPKKIVDIDSNQLKELIKPSGFYNQKAMILKNISNFLLTNPQPTREELLSVKGIGEETADSILLYYFNKLEFIIDAYTIRITERVGLGNIVEKKVWKKFYQNSLPKDIRIFNEFHALFVKHAKTFCRKINPLCQQCFLFLTCTFAKTKFSL